MSPLSEGSWVIESVVVNSETVMNYDGFEQLRIMDDCISISPAGLDLSVVQKFRASLILESQGQKFYGEFFKTGDAVELRLNRPKFTETITINGRVSSSPKCSTVLQKREVVQV